MARREAETSVHYCAVRRKPDAPFPALLDCGEGTRHGRKALKVNDKSDEIAARRDPAASAALRILAFKAVKARCARTLSRSLASETPMGSMTPSVTAASKKPEPLWSLAQDHQRPGRETKGQVHGTGKIECETHSQHRTRHRGQWAIESACTGRAMVMLSRDDDVHLQRSRTRQLHHPQITSPITHPPGARKDSLRLKRKDSAWHDDSLVSHVAA
jgi:hypothetical protein